MGGWEGGKNRPPITGFPLVTSTKVRISPQKFLTFSFKPFDRLLYSFKCIPSASPKLLNLNQDHPSKKWFFWSNFYKLELDNFSYRNARTTKLWSLDHIHNMIWVM